jgi:hypothetical protein
MESTQQLPATQTAIGYLGYHAFDDGDAYRGAILVTDERSNPLEFRCTAPVRPTPLQRTLYGKSLLPHILTELIAAPLIGSLREKPQMILISDDHFFDLRCKSAFPVIMVSASKAALRAKNSEHSKTLLIQSSSGKFSELEIEAHAKFPADLDSSGDRLRDLFGRWDLTEPFQRLAEGLKYVHDEHVLES